MNKFKKIYKKNKPLFIVDLALIIFGIVYNLFFVNRGLIFSDEGYYVHFAERIANGQIAYKDFALQYTPGYFYLLASLYKIFGVQILVGRFVSLIFCLFILIAVLYLLRLYKIYSKKVNILAALTIISLGYPLLHIPIIIWSCVFMAVLMQVIYIYWYRTHKLFYIIILGVLLGLGLFFRHSLGIIYILLINVIIFFSNKETLLVKLKQIAILNATWLIITALWFSYFFINANGFLAIVTIFEFSKQFANTLPFSYPSLTLLLQPTGFFKLLPYYFPVFYGFLILKKIITKEFHWEKLSFSLITIFGFFATVFPASDLLHVYPFLGLLTVSSIVLFHKKKEQAGILLIAFIFILIGFYLTFFTQSFRYSTYFLNEIKPLNLPKTKGILIDANDPNFSHLIQLVNFVNIHTKKNDYIFVYPFSPLLYTILDRQNPSGLAQFILVDAPSSIYPDERVIREIKEKKVKYIISHGLFNFDRKILKFIKKQTMVSQIGPYYIFKIK